MKLLLKDNNACTKQIYDIVNHNKVIAYKLPSNVQALNNCCTSLFEAMKVKSTGYEFIAQGALYYLIGTILENQLYVKIINILKRLKKGFFNLKML